MSDAALLKKLALKQRDMLVLNPPPSYIDRLHPEISVSTETYGSVRFSAVQLFVRNSAALSASFETAVRSVLPGGVVWVAYPKVGSLLAADLSRDRVAALAKSTGWQPVSQIAIDNMWSALRIRPADEVGR